MGGLRLTIFAIIALLFTIPATADSAGFGEAGGWTILKADDNCAMHQAFEGPGETELFLTKYANGELFIILTNSNWSAHDGGKYDLTYVIDRQQFGGGLATGITSSMRNGFVSGFGPEFERSFAEGSALDIYIGKQVIDRLRLAGTGRAMTMLNACLFSVNREIAAATREKARWADIPPDPFAGASAAGNAAPAKRVGPAPASPRDMTGTWLSANDYPTAALRELRSGRTSFKITVGTDGRATNCAVTASSGSRDLDDAACTTIMRRARFIPAIDAHGDPIEGQWSSTMSWTIPQQ